MASPEYPQFHRGEQLPTHHGGGEPLAAVPSSLEHMVKKLGDEYGIDLSQPGAQLRLDMPARPEHWMITNLDGQIALTRGVVQEDGTFAPDQDMVFAIGEVGGFDAPDDATRTGRSGSTAGDLPQYTFPGEDPLSFEGQADSSSESPPEQNVEQSTDAERSPNDVIARFIAAMKAKRKQRKEEGTWSKDLEEKKRQLDEMTIEAAKEVGFKKLLDWYSYTEE